MDELDAKNVDEVDEYQLTLMPPMDGADSDKDDAPSEDEGEQNIQSLGRRMLSQNCELNAIQNGELNEIVTNEAESSSHRPKPNKMKKIRHWLKNQLFRKSNSETSAGVPNQFKPFCANIFIEEESKPVDVFKKFFDSAVITEICSQTVKYAQYKGAINFEITEEEMYKFIGVLLLSGYVKVPNRRMYWEVQEDAFNIMVSNAISRNRFNAIMQYFHLNDNTTIDLNDKLYKVRPLIDHLNNKFQLYGRSLCTAFSIDEAMEPYYGRHHLKQFIRGKPIRFGFKFWCLNTSTGYLLKFIPYTGKHFTSINASHKYFIIVIFLGKSGRDTSTPLGESVVKTLAENIITEGSSIFIDNFFTSLQLLEEFKSKKINIVGTIRKNRIENAPLPDLTKSERGSSCVLQDRDTEITLIRWHDNSQVTMATNMTDTDIVLQESTCTRYSGIQKKKVTIPQPELIKRYNGGMGGVDLFDQQRGLYRIRIRSKKWYWPIFRFMLNGAVTNAWFLYREAHPNVPLLQFTRELVRSLLAENLQQKFHSISSKRPGPRPSNSSIQFDGMGHLIIYNPTQRKCALCKKCTKYICEKCNIGLHPKDCFKNYHIKQ